VPHTCPCGTEVDARGTHGQSCKRNNNRFTRHRQPNDLIWRSLCRANIVSVKESAGLCRSDGKRPNGLTQIPWQHGKCLTWDVTVADTVAMHLDTSTSLRSPLEPQLKTLQKGKRPNTRILPLHTPFCLWHLNLWGQLTKMACLSCPSGSPHIGHLR